MAKHYGTKCVLVLVLLGLLSAPAWAMDAQLQYAARGEMLCSRSFDLANPALLSLDAITWLAGYLTSFNYWTPGTYDIAPGKTAVPWIDQYCRLNPAEPFAAAAHAYVRQAYPTRQTTAPTTVLPPPPAAPSSSPLGTKTKRY